MIQTWIKLFTGPNDNTFQEVSLNPDASFGTAVLWRFVGILIAAVLGYLGSFLGLGNVQAQIQQVLASQSDLPPEVRQAIEQVLPYLTPTNLGIATVVGIFSSLIGFILICGFFHLVARMLGGQGSFGTFSYLSAGVWSPVSIVQSALSLIPILGSCLGAIVGIYGLVLSYFAIKTNYQLSDGRAILVLVMPILLVIALIACGFFALIALAASVQGQ